MPAPLEVSQASVTLIVATTSAVVSVVVVAMNLWQNRWHRDFSERQQAIDLRANQLALLDKRLAVLETIGGVVARFYTQRGRLDTRDDSLFNCLLEGQALFDGDLANRLHEAWLLQVDHHNARITAESLAGPPSKAGSEASFAKAEQLRESLFETVRTLHKDMIAAARVII